MMPVSAEPHPPIPPEGLWSHEGPIAVFNCPDPTPPLLPSLSYQDTLRMIGLMRDAEKANLAKGRRQGILEAASLARDHDIGEDAKADRALDTLAEKLERLAGEDG